MNDLVTCTVAAPEMRVGRYRNASRAHDDLAPAMWRLPALEVGTGGVASLAFIRQPYGYVDVGIVDCTPVEPEAVFARDMVQIKTGFGRTMSCLPGIFGVSRQTLYNWLGGQTPKERHQQPLHQLAQAAAIFTELGFRPTAAMLGRTIESGKSFTQLIASGADGRDTAKKLVRVVRRGRDSRTKLDALLAGKRAGLDASDFGAPFPDERA